MKNVLYIDATNDCECSLVSSINDGTNSLFLEIKSDLSLNPYLAITISNFVNIQITTNPFIYEVTPFQMTLPGVDNIHFYIKDDTHTGENFTIYSPSAIKGNLIIGQTSNFNYTLTDIIKDECVKRSDIVNNLTAAQSTGTSKVLSAYQGRVLNANKISNTAIKNNLTTLVSGKYVLDAHQGQVLKNELDRVSTEMDKRFLADSMLWPTISGDATLAAMICRLFADGYLYGQAAIGNYPELPVQSWTYTVRWQFTFDSVTVVEIQQLYYTDKYIRWLNMTTGEWTTNEWTKNS